MDSFEFNKIAGAVLATALVVFGLKELSAAVYHSETPEKPGFAIEVAEASGAGEAQASTGPAVSLGTLLASADPVKGAAGAKACAACHDFSKGGPNKTGPDLWDVVDRGIASHEGFAYSEGMKARSAEKWTYEALDAFIKDPKTATPKTKMAFAGVKKDQARADIIAYLASLSDAPKPFPAP
ncbi:MAG TPA: cytochrome c family protein [Aestuariivirga sp.]|nr:cytochrome c family protein [Aestuariivirga sp.]